MRYHKLATAEVPQTEQLDPRQVQNNAGGYVFEIDDWGRLDRFLILGSDAPTYYQNAKELTRQNAACVERCYASNPERTVGRIVEISDSGRAPKNDSAIFALALGAVHKDQDVRRLALGMLSRVCRTSTHLFAFVKVVRALGRGWGRALKRAVARWYAIKSVDQLAYQFIKYRSREDYTHKRLLETARRAADQEEKGTKLQRTALYQWAKGKKLTKHKLGFLPEKVVAHVAVMGMDNKKKIVQLVKQHDLPWEAIPTELTTNPDIWKAMLPNMPLTAMIRNLNKMTAYGALKPLSKEVDVVVERLTSSAHLLAARVHPFNLLLAKATYDRGIGTQAWRRVAEGKEALRWEAIPAVSAALEEAFYRAFTTITPTGKRTMVCLDVSGSMSSPLMGSPLQVNEGAAAMAMTVLRTEPKCHVMAFDTGLRELPITAKTDLRGVLKYTKDINGGGTDCSLPMIWALDKGFEVDVFSVWTDNETWAGRMHPVKALQDYRRKTGIPAKLVVVGMTATNFSIADPQDAGMLDVVGFDSAAPALIADFGRD